jgi:superfamily II DNA/RNA helicase
MQQVSREKAMRRFREGKVDVLVATDVAARGLDVEGVTHVINYNCPDDDKNYLHRIGRTGRAGASGIAVTFVDWPDMTRWKLINTAMELPFEEPVETYSTSDNLYHDLGIPRSATGRLVPPEPVAAATRQRSAPSGGVATQTRRSGAPRERSRSRTRAGQPLSRPAQSGGDASTADPATGGYHLDARLRAAPQTASPALRRQRWRSRSHRHLAPAELRCLPRSSLGRRLGSGSSSRGL